ncbi:hypothetical protein [Aureispira anguillae]|uniref:Uncharacterized protein n=1 Tax=Aureispira anguillae TaxID=2864201 RepID=A0A915YBZ0_9BACT|nr:hypothetical protein [Aureispira anguillae]BDS10213.1 hypothetical protein AsAng_0009210 [Aureispira anguillae]
MPTPQLNLIAQSILFLMPSGIQSNFQVRLGVHTDATTVLSKGDFTIANCKDIPDAVDKAMQLITAMNLSIADNFILVLPPFIGKNEAEEAALIDTAWMIKEAADKGGWEFSRHLPAPIF